MRFFTSKSTLMTITLTLFSLCAFAANSIICRKALASGNIDPAFFTLIRLGAGAFTLFAIYLWSQRHNTLSFRHGSWLGAILLFTYALTFSYAYIQLDTGTGALILFTLVQLTILGVSILRGVRYNLREIAGAGIAFFGFVFLITPANSSITAISAQVPDISSTLLMAIAGIAWGGYTLLGARSKNPLADTSMNFLRCTPAMLILFLLTATSLTANTEGVLLAILSGAVASGIGYAIWYAVLPKLPSMLSALLQLTVPLLASGGGLLINDEAITGTFIIASACILGGISITITTNKKSSKLAKH